MSKNITPCDTQNSSPFSG